ncbi:MAG: hypothetical protein ABII90_04075, partial [Bacteroidota bacterium]
MKIRAISGFRSLRSFPRRFAIVASLVTPLFMLGAGSTAGCMGRTGLEKGELSEAATKDAGVKDANAADAMPDAKPDAMPDADIPDATFPCPETGETLNVPSAYPTIQEAITASSPGDTIQLAEGEYNNVFGLEMKPCTKLTGEHMYQTKIYDDSKYPYPTGQMFKVPYGCHISNVTILNAGHIPSKPFVAILLEDGKGEQVRITDSTINSILVAGGANPSMVDSVLTTITVKDKATPEIKGDIIYQINYEGESGGYLGDNSIGVLGWGGLKISGNASPLVRGNHFHVVDYEGPFYHFGVLVEGSAKPDLGTNSDPGDNIFDNQSKPGEYFGFSI